MIKRLAKKYPPSATSSCRDEGVHGSEQGRQARGGLAPGRADEARVGSRCGARSPVQPARSSDQRASGTTRRVHHPPSSRRWHSEGCGGTGPWATATAHSVTTRPPPRCEGPHTVSPSLHLPREDPRTDSPSPRPPREGPRTPAQPPPREVHYTHQALPWRRVCAEYAWTWRRRLCSRSRETPPGRASKMQPAEPLLLSGQRGKGS